MKKDFDFLFELDKINRFLTNKIQHEFKASGQGISYADFMVLCLIEDKMKQSDLIEITDKDKGSMSRHLKALIKKDLIYSIPIDNHKNRHIRMTHSGLKAIKNGMYLMNKIRKHELKIIAKSDVENISKLYQKLVKQKSKK